MTDVRGPDGRVVRFPDGTDNATISRVMSEIYSKPAVQAPSQADTGLRSVVNGLTAGFGDKAAAALETVIPGIGNPGTQTVWQNGSLSNAYAHNRDLELARTHAGEQANPGTALAGNVVGALASPISRFAAPVEGASLAANGGRLIANGAAYGGLYGAGQSQADTYGGQAMDAVKGAAEGAAGNLLGAGVAKLGGAALAGTNNVAARALDAAGIELTPGQIMGGAWKAAEDKLTSIPLLGDAINAARARGVQSFNAERINSALKPIGAELPEGVSGADALMHGQNAIDEAYQKARQGMTFTKDEAYNEGLAKLQDRITNGGADSLAPAYRRQFSDVLKNTVERNLGEDGQMSGDTLKKVVSSINKKAASLSAGNNPADAQEYGAALKELAGLLDQGARRNPGSDPAAAQLMDRADEAYRQWVLIQNAARRQGGELGTFSPGQYDAAVKQADRTVRNRAYITGNAFGQPMSTNAVDVMGRNAPNSFTADRLMMAKLASGAVLGGLGYKAGLDPTEALALAGAGAGGASLYGKAGTKLARNVLIGARPTSVAVIGKKLNSFAPAIGRAGATLAIQKTAK